jgi:hypothetical protein
MMQGYADGCLGAADISMHALTYLLDSGNIDIKVNSLVFVLTDII